MQVIIDEVETFISELISLGVGRNIGKGQPDLGLESFEGVIWAKSITQAENLQASDGFADFLLYLRPEMDFESIEERDAFGGDMNEIASQIKTVCERTMEGLVIPGLSNTPVGFRASYEIQTLEFILISLAQENLAKKKYGMVEPFPCQELANVYQAGHIVCGYLWNDESSRIVLY